MLADRILEWIGENPETFPDREKWVVIEVWLSQYYPPVFAFAFAAYPWAMLWWRYKKKRQKITKANLLKAAVLSVVLGYIGYWVPDFLGELLFGIGFRFS
ncbi:MAG: hypothetical protein WEC84_04075 [Candidatus Andersenbacteria bacterium]